MEVIKNLKEPIKFYYNNKEKKLSQTFNFLLQLKVNF